MTTPFPVALPPLTEKLCPGCALTKPASEYRTVAGELVTQCYECEKAEAKGKLLLIEKERQEHQFRDIIKQVGNKANRAPQVAEVVEVMLGHFAPEGGTGLNGFVKFYYDQLQVAAAEKPGSKVVLDACKNIYLMIESANQQAANLDFGLLSDDDLARTAIEVLSSAPLKLHAEDSGAA